MTRLAGLLAAIALVLAGCGKYGPPVRTRPAPPAATAPSAAAALPGEPGDTQEEEEQAP